MVDPKMLEKAIAHVNTHGGPREKIIEIHNRWTKARAKAKAARKARKANR